MRLLSSSDRDFTTIARAHALRREASSRFWLLVGRWLLARWAARSARPRTQLAPR